jgi:hypothetical protein
LSQVVERVTFDESVSMAFRRRTIPERTAGRG